MIFKRLFTNKIELQVSHSSDFIIESATPENPYTPSAKRSRQGLVCSWGLYATNCLTHSRLVSYRATPVLPLCWLLIQVPKAKARTPSPCMYKFIGSTVAILASVPAALVSKGDFWSSPHTSWSREPTPIRCQLFSIVIVLANQMPAPHPFNLPNTAWKHKSFPTFTDALALVRQQLWQFRLFQLFNQKTDTVILPPTFFKCWFDLLCYAVSSLKSS